MREDCLPHASLSVPLQGRMILTCERSTVLETVGNELASAYELASAFRPAEVLLQSKTSKVTPNRNVGVRI